MLGLLLFGCAVLYATNMTSRSVVDSMLHSEAKDVTRGWLNRAEWELFKLTEVFATGSLRAIDVDHLPDTAPGDRVFRYELYDRTGGLIYSTGVGGLSAETPPRSFVMASVTAASKELKSSLRDGYAAKEDGRTRTQYALVAKPYPPLGDSVGTIVAYVDQTKQAQLLTKSLKFVAAVTAALILLAILVPSLLAFFKIRERWKAQAHIQYLSDNDKLTGLLNRSSFGRELEAKLELRRESGGGIAVIAINVDRFKDVNDSMGHAAGDSILRCVAERLRTNIGAEDVAARLGSDEFVVALNDVRGPVEIVGTVQRLRDALGSSYWVDGQEIPCTASMGAAVAPDDGDDVATLLRHAALALDRAKKVGRNTFKFFDRDMDMAFLRRRERANDLHQAIDQDQFNLVYQPQIRLSDGALASHEALVRWNHPEHGNISPNYFISIAEETEIIVPLGEWILRRACLDAVSWPEPRNVAVNLSPVQFKRTSVYELVARVLDETGLAPSQLELEITENLLMWDTEAVLRELTKLRELGVDIALDDFGTGYSSLSYLSRFPFSKIKIDRTFVRALAHDQRVNAIMCCIVALGRSLGMTITAEGVETQEQAEFIRRLGCDLAQGFLYGYPVSAAESAKLIEASKTPPEPRPESSAA
ncbi:MAG: EAL domain-containing protein [Hyphomicrobiales bacterium]|nr:EAL domain-containing protein [Hyphomicrobiales bacterium]